MSGDREVYTRARRVLLDALEALAEHRRAVILVGAQAVYLRTGEDEKAAAPYTLDLDLAVSPFTSDGDIALDPAELSEEPLLEAAMTAAHFERDRSEPGIWWRDEIEVDLLVPARVGGPGRRGARLRGHGNRAARKVFGLEAALVDSSPLTIAALDTADRRAFEVRVAGPAALLVAKAHKLQDREGQDERLVPKDALDVYRLLRNVSRDDLVAGFLRALADEVSREVTEEALEFVDGAFGVREGVGLELLVRSIEGLDTDVALTIESCRILAADLVAAVIETRG